MRPGPGSFRGAQEGHPVRILLVEDHRVFAEVLAARMRAETGVESIQIATSLSEARVGLQRTRSDLVLLDFQLDGEFGLDLLIDLRAMDTPPKVLMLSGVAGAPQVVKAFRAGAEGWVSKTAPFETLMHAAGEVVGGRMYLAPPELKPVLLYLLAAGNTGTGDVGPSWVDGLSARQLDVLRCVVSGMSRAECAAYLHLSVHTVRTHVQHLLKRADLHSTLALASAARNLGVVGVDEEHQVHR